MQIPTSPDEEREASTRKLAATVAGCTQVGDLVMVSGTDQLSKLIQWGTSNVFGHVAVVTAENEITESYEEKIRPSERHDDVRAMAIADFVARPIDKLKIIRPIGLDVERLVDASTHFAASTIPFPTIGILYLTWCRLSIPLLRILPSPIRHPLARLQARLSGDRAVTMHCSESASRLYIAAGMAIEFPEPMFALHIQSIKHEPDPCDVHSPEQELTIGLPAGQDRPLSRLQSTADLYDFITPADLDRSPSFEPVARFECHNGIWAEVG